MSDNKPVPFRRFRPTGKVTYKGLPPFGEIMMEILDKTPCDPMGGHRAERMIGGYKEHDRPKKVTTAKPEVMDFCDDFVDEIWRRTFFPQPDKKLPASTAIDAVFCDENESKS